MVKIKEFQVFIHEPNAHQSRYQAWISHDEFPTYSFTWGIGHVTQHPTGHGVKPKVTEKLAQDYKFQTEHLSFYNELQYVSMCYCQFLDSLGYPGDWLGFLQRDHGMK